jgi:dienelactone hydrolase
MSTPETLRYDADGLAMAGALYLPARMDGARPGVLVFPDASGLNAHARERASRLADLGYVALACDLHGGGEQLQDFEAAMAVVRTLREAPERTRARAAGALAALVARPDVDATRVAAIGFCFGGTMALELARSGAALVAVVGFHSGLATQRPEDAVHVRAHVLACIGADDPSIPPAQRAAFEQEMTAARVDWQLHLYGGVVHSFTEPGVELRTGRPDRTRYDAAADARSWAAMRQLFAETLDVPRDA